MVDSGMGNIKFLGKSASAIGVALDIRDIGGMVRNGFSAAGGATVISGLVKEVASLSSPTSIVIGVGSLLILLSFRPGLPRTWLHKKDGQYTTSKIDIKRDALDHFQVESGSRNGLNVNEDLAGNPVMYPLTLRNTRPLPVDIVGYEVTILWNDKPVNTVRWQPPSPTTSSGFRVVPSYTATSTQELIRIDGDTCIEFGIPVNLRQIGSLPTQPPRWGINGYLSLVCAGEPKTLRTMTFNLDTDNQQIDDQLWGRLRSDIMIG